MGNVNMEAYQIHDKEHGTVAEHLRALDLEVEKSAALPDLPTAEGKTVLTATTDDQGETELSYEAPEVEQADIAPAFSEEVTYPEGALVYYEGILYKFTSDHTAGSWDPSEATPTSAAAEFVETNAAVDELKNTLTSVAERIDANVLSDVKITLAFGTEYVVPADGYLRGTVNAGSSKYISLLGKCTDGTWYTLAQAGDTTIINDVISLFVRKGMSVQFSGSSSTDVSCYFIPLTSNE